jgi:hypothetical protein
MHRRGPQSRQQFCASCVTPRPVRSPDLIRPSTLEGVHRRFGLGSRDFIGGGARCGVAGTSPFQRKSPSVAAILTPRLVPPASSRSAPTPWRRRAADLAVAEQSWLHLARVTEEIEVVVTSNGARNATYRPALPSMSANTRVEPGWRALALTVVLMFLLCAEAYAETVSLSCSETLRALRVRYRT